MNTSATHLNQKPGDLIDQALSRGTVIIERRKKPVIVLMDYKRYEYFLELEDEIWGERGLRAKNEAKLMSAKESKEFLES